MGALPPRAPPNVKFTAGQDEGAGTVPNEGSKRGAELPKAGTAEEEAVGTELLAKGWHAAPTAETAAIDETLS